MLSSQFKAIGFRSAAQNFTGGLCRIDYHPTASQLGMQFAYREVRYDKDLEKKSVKNIAGFSLSKSLNNDIQKCSLLVANAKNIDCL